MFYNAKIHWKPGMALTDTVMRRLENSLDSRQQLVLRAALADGRTGLLPGLPFHAEGSFVGRTYELNELQLTALLPSGRIVDADGQLKMDIPKLTEKEYFLCLGFSDSGPRLFEREGVPYEEPLYELSLHTLDDIVPADVVPIKRFVIDDGVLSIDEHYVPPVLTVCASQRLVECISLSVGDIEGILAHSSLAEGEGKRCLSQKLFELKNFNVLRSSRHLVNTLQELAMAVKYYIVDAKEQELAKGLIAERQEGGLAKLCNGRMAQLWNDSRRQPSMLNVASYIEWLHEWLGAQTAVLDLVQIVDNSIDYEQLKREIKEELYAQLREEIYEKMIVEMHDRLHDRLAAELKQVLKECIDDIVPRIKRELADELHDKLYGQLYDALFKALYDELYRPDDEVVDEFVPMI